ncbi:phenylalanine--tRNA ligase beta subunit [Brevipalpus obovatus]|uniref:phenylalanine--tRNA ligase beta subunit n=1 Tax=Brevipalpus obovatus TaxID=246614 RepID=UPI003D9F0CB8
MPTIGIKRDLLMQGLGFSYTEEQFNDLCFEFGLELDEVTSEKEMISKEKGDEQAHGASDEVVFKIDIPANRYDLLCISGLVRALLIFQGKASIPNYLAVSPSSGNLAKIIVKQNTSTVRPFVVGAILRNINFTHDTYESFIDLQDKLHQNICRKRSLVAIGTHDLDTVHGPFIYDAQPPSNIKFKPLNESQEYTAAQLMDHYSGNSHLKPYLPIIRDKPLYPVILDSRGTVLSFPPIINGDHSKITIKTKNVLIECTATDENKAKIVLDTIVCMFSEYCSPKFQSERVEIFYEESGTTKTYPELLYRNEEVSVPYMNQLLNLKNSPEQLCKILGKMGLRSSPSKSNSDLLDVIIPPTRHDILHTCDILEDVAISYGYNNIERTCPSVVTEGSQFPVNKLSDQLRNEVARCGYTEALTFSLCSEDDIGLKMRNGSDLERAVKIANPKTVEFQVARTSLIPGLLRTIESNKKMPLPMKVFEISDVVLKDKDKGVGVKNNRMLAAVNYNKSPGFEIIHGLLDRVMQALEVPWSTDTASGYHIQAIDDPRFLAGRCASIIFRGKRIGTLGVLHPEVILNFSLTMPCSALEIDLEPFLADWL